MTKRNSKQINMDYRIINSIYPKVTCFEQLEEATGLSRAQIKSSFKNHPVTWNKMLRHFEACKAKLDEKEESILNYVIDASIVCSTGFRERMKEIMENENSKVTLTSVTIRELEKLQNKKFDRQAIDARYLLALAVNNPEKISSVLIREEDMIPDDAIIAYCIDNKEGTLLLTSDKTMTLKARMHGVKEIYCDKTAAEEESEEKRTLKEAFMANGTLNINTYNTRIKKLYVYSNGIEYTSGLKCLEIGDDVFVVKAHVQHITFNHFKITDIRERMNCELVYSTRVYNDSHIYFSNSKYQSFVKDFIANM